MPIIDMHMHTGVYFTLPGRKIYLFEEYFNYYINSIAEFSDLAADLAGSKGLIITIENTGIYNLSYIVDAVTVLLKRECFRLTWDIGHDYSNNCIDSGFILEDIKYVKHFHLHDAVRNKDHMPLGTEEIDIHNKIDIARSNNCSCVIETKTIDGLRKSVDILRKG